MPHHQPPISQLRPSHPRNDRLILIRFVFLAELVHHHGAVPRVHVPQQLENPALAFVPTRRRSVDDVERPPEREAVADPLNGKLGFPAVAGGNLGHQVRLAGGDPLLIRQVRRQRQAPHVDAITVAAGRALALPARLGVQGLGQGLEVLVYVAAAALRRRGGGVVDLDRELRTSILDADGLVVPCCYLAAGEFLAQPGGEAGCTVVAAGDLLNNVV